METYTEIVGARVSSDIKDIIEKERFENELDRKHSIIAMRLNKLKETAEHPSVIKNKREREWIASLIRINEVVFNASKAVKDRRLRDIETERANR